MDDTLLYLVSAVLIAVGLLLIMRLFGAWMLRIDDVIKGLQANNAVLLAIHKELKKANAKPSEGEETPPAS